MANPSADIPPIVFGSSALGNLYGVVPDASKKAIVANWCSSVSRPVIDSAGKYGAGLALESIGRFLAELHVDPQDVRISNKLGWKRVPLSGAEPSFEPGVWHGLAYDAENVISYDGVLECFEQGNRLLAPYRASMVSVHDPDEYVTAIHGAATPSVPADADARFQDVLGAYRALEELKAAGEVDSIGIGAKDWRMIERVVRAGVRLDWVMFATSYTVYRHPAEVREFMSELEQSGTAIINSAVYHGGFLTGSDYFDYRPVTRDAEPELFSWRDRFHAACAEFGVTPAHACCQFALRAPGVVALALNTSRPGRVTENIRIVSEPVPEGLWELLCEEGLISYGARESPPLLTPEELDRIEEANAADAPPSDKWHDHS